MEPAKRIRMLENRLAVLNAQLVAYKDEVNLIKEGGRTMDFREEEPHAEKHQEEKKRRKATRALTAAQKRKIEEFKKRLEEESRGPVNTIPRGAEWRG